MKIRTVRADTSWVSLDPAQPMPRHREFDPGQLPAATPEDRVESDERRRLGAVLVGRGLVTPADLQTALDSQPTAPAERRRLGQVLVDLEMVTELEVASAVADLLGLPLIDLSAIRPDPDLLRVLPRAFAAAHRVAVIERRGDRLVVALADPLNVVVLDDVRLIAGVKELDVRVATDSQVVDLITRMYASGAGARAVDLVLEQLDLPLGRTGDAAQLASVTDVESAPVVRLVNAILSGALDARASDVHIEPTQAGLRVRYRVDGMLRDVMEVPPGAALTVRSRRRRRPQLLRPRWRLLVRRTAAPDGGLDLRESLRLCVGGRRP